MDLDKAKTEIEAHPFFQGIDWEALDNYEMVSPITVNTSKIQKLLQNEPAKLPEPQDDPSPKDIRISQFEFQRIQFRISIGDVPPSPTRE
jgi:hypothetical protein